MLGIALRVPFTTIPPVLSNIAAGLHVSVSSLGLLTTLPLVMFAIFSAIAPKLAQLTSLERLFAIVLALMIVGSAIRLFNLPMFYVGTLIIGATIAILNVLLPSIIVATDSNGIGKYTTLYTTASAISMAVFSALAVPIVLASNWRVLILILTVVTAAIFVIWLPNLKSFHQLSAETTTADKRPTLWKNKGAWALMFFGGLQSFLFYTGMTWFPTMAQEAGLSQATAGILSSLYTLIGLPFSLFLPIALTSMVRKRRQLIMVAMGMLGFLGCVLLLFPSDNLWHWILINAATGLSCGALFPYLLTAYSIKTNNATDTARLSGMAQTGGYFIAAIGPAAVGYTHLFSHSWLLGSLFLVVATAIMTLLLFYIESFDKIVE